MKKEFEVIRNVRGVREQRPLHLLYVKKTDPNADPIIHKPGELLDIEVPNAPGRNRQYSFAGWDRVSQSFTSVYELIVRDAGVVGSSLCKMIDGDVFYGEYIGGMFLPRPDGILFSSGSGMAPFRALFSNYPDYDNFECLYFCNVDSKDEKREIIGDFHAGDGVVDHHTIETESLDEHYKAITNAIRKGRYNIERPHYVCGSSRYVTETCSLLVEEGVDPLNIETDIYAAAPD